MAEKIHGGRDIFDLLDHVDSTYDAIPDNLKLEIDRLSKKLSQLGSRMASRAGSGLEVFSIREYNPQTDPGSAFVSVRHSARNPERPVVLEREDEIKQTILLWRDPRMIYQSRPEIVSKKQAAEVSMLALARKLAKDDDHVSIMQGRTVHRLQRNAYAAASHVQDVIILDEPLPEIGRRVAKNTSAVFFGEYYDHDETLGILDNLYERDLSAHLVMMLDPREIDFDFKDNTEIFGLNGEKSASGKISFEFGRVKDVKLAWQAELRKHIEWLEHECDQRGFDLVLQRTDKHLENGLIQILGKDRPDVKAQFIHLGLG